jgi:hypothetical protein
MAGFIYGLCALTAFLCALLLLQAYRQTQYRLLLWGGLCFAGLTLNNGLVLVDKYVVGFMDLSTVRLLTALTALLIFLYGLIYDTE